MFLGNRKHNRERADKLAKLFNGSASEQILSIGVRMSTHMVEGVAQSVKYRIGVFRGGLALWLYGFYLPNGIIISLNRTYPAMIVEEPITDLFPEYGMPIYKSNLLADMESIERLLGDRLTLTIVRDLHISHKEQLYIASQQIILRHLSREDEFFERRFKALLQLIMHHAVETPAVAPDTVTSRYADSPHVKIDPQKIPEKLRALIPLARQWAIGDDNERQRYLNSASKHERRTLVDAVSGLRDEIEKWTLQHRSKTPVPDEVVLFDMLSEAAAEAETEFL